MECWQIWAPHPPPQSLLVLPHVPTMGPPRDRDGTVTESRRDREWTPTGPRRDRDGAAFDGLFNELNSDLFDVIESFNELFNIGDSFSELFRVGEGLQRVLQRVNMGAGL